MKGSGRWLLAIVLTVAWADIAAADPEADFNRATQLLATGQADDLAASIAHFARALDNFADAGDARRAAHARFGLGTALWRKRSYDEATTQLQSAAHALESFGDLSGAAAATTNLGLLTIERGSSFDAALHLEDALDLAHTAGDLRAKARAETNLASLYAEIGAWRVALDLFRRALADWRTVDDRASLGIVHGDLGLHFLQLRSLDAAREHLRAAEILNRGRGDLVGAADNLVGLGLVARAEGELATAERLLTEAKTLHARAGNRTGEAIAGVNLATVLLDRHDAGRHDADRHSDRPTVASDSHWIDAARREARSAQRLASEVGDPRTEARAWIALATASWKTASWKAVRVRQTEERRDDPNPDPRTLDEARDAAHEAARMLASLDDPLGSSDAALAQARVAWAAGNLDRAAQYAETAARRLERLRWPRADALFASAFGGQRAFFDALVAIELDRWRKGDNPNALRNAFQAADRGRRHARRLIDFRGAAGDSVESRLRDEIRQRVEARRRARRAGRTGEVTALDRELRALALSRDMRLADAADGAAGTLHSDPTRVDAERIDPARLAAAIDPSTSGSVPTSLLVFHFGEGVGTLFVLDRHGLDAFDLGVRRTIETRADRFRVLIATPPSRMAEAPIDVLAEDLGTRLLAPLLRTKQNPMRDLPQRLPQRLLVVHDDPLEGVPIAALRVPAADGSDRSRAIGLDHEIVLLPSAAAAGELTERRPWSSEPGASKDRVDRLALVRGDFSERPTLPGATRAIAVLETIAGTHGQTFGGEDVATILAGGLAGFRYVHFATHAEIDSREPAASRLVLGDDPQQGLQLVDLEHLGLEAELVSLAACRTADGLSVPGAGVLGFARTLLAAGVPRIVVSHWRVDDASTAALMIAFYRAILESGARPAAALRTARRAVAADPRWRAPHHWAAFTLVGDWR